VDATSTNDAGPLSGVRIVDLTANMSGPLATMILGDQGADVIKIESGIGDMLRYLGSGSKAYATFYANLNRSKRSILLDLRRAEARPIFDALLDRADVVVHNLRPQAAAQLKIDADSIRATRPQLVHVAISGFGTSGPFRDRRAYDHVVQAAAGYASVQADLRSGEPDLVRQGVVDKVTALYVAQAITAALFERTRTGVGRNVELSMLDSAVAFLWPDAMTDLTAVSPDIVGTSIRRTYRLTRTTNGHIVFMAMIGEQHGQLGRALGIDPELQSDGPAFYRECARRIGERTTEEALELLHGSDIPAAMAVSLEHLHEQPEIQFAGSIDEFDHPVLGRARQANPVARFTDARAGTLRPAPVLGEHTREICAELGLDDARIDELTSEGVLS
jgi:crotonobetainyl-CoA:carnitine CoA-transferase CaiB-like acyl-CoA transferase